MNKQDLNLQLAYLEKALKMGARFDVYFHNVESKEAAEKIANELTSVAEFNFEDGRAGVHNWLSTGFGKISTNIFYNEYMKEDVDLSGGMPEESSDRIA